MTNTPTMIFRIFAACSFAAVASALPASAQAADFAKEAATGEAHAAMAVNAATIEQVHMHLHHVVNCLVGPKGAEFDAKQANPCQSLGDGAIPDAANPAAKAKLAAALAKAEAGLKASDLSAAKQAATEAQAAFK